MYRCLQCTSVNVYVYTSFSQSYLNVSRMYKFFTYISKAPSTSHQGYTNLGRVEIKRTKLRFKNEEPTETRGKNEKNRECVDECATRIKLTGPGCFPLFKLVKTYPFVEYFISSLIGPRATYTLKVGLPRFSLDCTSILYK